MRKLRHSLALSALCMAACIGESPWEIFGDRNGRASVSPDHEQTNNDAGVAAADSGMPGDASEDANDAGVNAVDWRTPFVALLADDFRINVEGKEFLGKASDTRLLSDPGMPDAYTSFERTWTENDVEMRLFMYFHSDGSDWWVSEIRIYDGRVDAEWLAHTGELFRRPLGQAFTGNLDLTLDVPIWSSEMRGDRGPGRLTMRNLTLQAFARPKACFDQNDGYVVHVLPPRIDLTTATNAGFVVNAWLRDHDCKPEIDFSKFDLLWTVDDPTIVGLAALRPTHASVYGVAAGETKLHVTAKRLSDNVAIAEGTMDVVVK